MNKRLIIYFVLLIGSLIFSTLVGGAISYALLFGLIFITPICFIYLLTVYAFVRIYQVVGSKHITVYEPVSYYFVLMNEFPLNFCSIKVSMFSNFSYVENGPDGQTYELLPSESARFDTNLICKYRGDYSVGVEKITITDFLGLYKITYRVPEPLNLTVSPRIIPLNQLRSVPELSISTFHEDKNQALYFDNSTREYVPGDPMKGIHWKASAKSGKLQSRLTYGEQKQGVVLFLEARRCSSKPEEFIPLENKMLEITLALSNYFASASVPSTTYYMQDKLIELSCENSNDISKYLATVSALRFREMDTTEKALDLLMSKAAFASCQVAFFVVNRLNNELFARLQSLYNTPTVIYFVSDSEDLGDAFIDLPNLHLIRIHSEDDLQKML